MATTNHAAEAERLLDQSRRLRRLANDPDAAGSASRDGYRLRADTLLAEAQVHANLAATTTIAVSNRDAGKLVKSGLAQLNRLT